MDIQQTTRRQFLQTGATMLAAGFIAPRSIYANPALVDLPTIDDPALRILTTRALETAVAAGATYADVRLTLTRIRKTSVSGNMEIYNVFGWTDYEVAVGIRTLVGGFWGFAASPIWTNDEMVRLANDAIVQAKTNNWGSMRVVELGPPIAPAVGTWSMPVTRDPFSVSMDEILDRLWSVRACTEGLSSHRLGVGADLEANFQRQDKIFASTEGAFCTQVGYAYDCGHALINVWRPDQSQRASARLRGGTPSGGGYNEFLATIQDEEIQYAYEEAHRRLQPSRPVDVGRYEVVFDASAVATLMSPTIGVAMELDRVLGDEANAGGTSYLGPIENHLGARLSSQMVSITGNRSQPGGLATVKWDDDGVTPEEFALIRDGLVVDYATSREYTTVLADWYKKQQHPVRSHGCANSGSAFDVPLISPPNLVLQPGRANTTFEDLVANVANGIAIKGGRCFMDHQQLTGVGFGEALYEIKNGKLGQPLVDGQFLFRSAELWNNINALGGAGSALTYGFRTTKGQPEQTTGHSVTAVPMNVKNVAFTNVRRKV